MAPATAAASVMSVMSVVPDSLPLTLTIPLLFLVFHVEVAWEEESGTTDITDITDPGGSGNHR